MDTEKRFTDREPNPPLDPIPGQRPGSYKAYKIAAREAGDIEKVLLSNGFEKKAARSGRRSFVPFIKKARIQGVFLAVSVYEGTLAIETLIEPPESNLEKDGNKDRTGGISRWWRWSPLAAALLLLH